MLFDARLNGQVVRVEVKDREGRFAVTLDGRPLEAELEQTGEFSSLLVDGQSYELGLEERPGGYRVLLPGRTLEVDLADAATGTDSLARPSGGPARVTAPMPGKLLRVLVEAGQEVEPGQGLLVMEAMKMENELRAPRAGRVEVVAAREGQAVETGALLLVLE